MKGSLLMRRVVKIFAVGTLVWIPILSRAQSPLEGDWVGTLTEKPETAFIRAHFKTEKGSISGSLDIPFQGGNGLPVSLVTLESSRVHFEAPFGGQTLVFDGTSQVGTISGKIQQGNEQGTFSLARIAKIDSKVLNKYLGAYDLESGKFLYLQPWAEIGENQLLYTDESGNIRAFFPSSDDTFFAGPGLLLPLPSEMQITFKTKPSRDAGELVLRQRGSPDQVAKKADVYREEEVHFGNGDVNLAGVLLKPSTKGTHPAIVLIHGSGPEDRRYLLPFTDFLARRGIALLGYDKRGVGGSTGDWHKASFQDLASDALAAIEYLKGRPDINARQIGVLGVSQGGWIGPLTASLSKDVAFVISVSGPSVTPGEQGIENRAFTMRADGFSEDEIAQAVAIEKLTNEFIRTGNGWEQLEAESKKVQDQKWAAQLGELPPRDFWYWGFMRLIIDYDPIPVVAKVKCPILAIFGGLDSVVPLDKNIAGWELALNRGGNKDYEIAVFPRGNHMILTSETGGRNDLAKLRSFEPGFFDSITEWVLRHVAIRNDEILP